MAPGKTKKHNIEEKKKKRSEWREKRHRKKTVIRNAKNHLS